MSPVTASVITCALTYGGSLLGMRLRASLPAHHLRDESRDVVKLAVGLVGTIAALVLGLLVASGKGYYDTQTSELTQLSASVVVLDRTLAHYGPETKEARESLRAIVVAILERSWSRSRSEAPRSDPISLGGGILYDRIQALTPRDDSQRSLHSQALSMVVNLGHMRWLMFEQGAVSVSRPLLAVMVFWLTVIFVVWGLLATPNGTVIATLLVSALSASGAILLILELHAPYQGLIQVSDAPLRAALASLGR